MRLQLFSSVLLVFSIILVNSSEVKLKPCEEKENTLALLDISKDALIKAKDLIPGCNEDNPVNKTECGLKEKSGAFIDVALKLIDDARDSYPNCGGTEEYTPYSSYTSKLFRRLLSVSLDLDDDLQNEAESSNSISVDCMGVLQSGQKKSGIYPIRFRKTDGRYTSLNVYCDMDTEGGGWTVIQRRNNYSVQENFNRDWNSYKMGFGNISRDFWLGNENIFQLGRQANNTLRFDLGDVKGERKFATYDYFKLENVSTMYKLYISNYSGNAGDSMGNYGDPFSTTETTPTACAKFMSGGWWFNRYCASANPNGLYLPGKSNDVKSLHWFAWKQTEGLSFAEIKLRRKLNT